MVNEVKSPRPGERIWASALGRLVVRELTDSVTLFIEEGYLEADFGPRVCEALQATLRRPGLQHLFVDAQGLEGYAPEIQLGATEWIRRNRARISTQHMLVTSRLTQTGLSLASVNLGDAVRGYNVRERFEAALAEALGRGAAPQQRV